MKKTQTFFKTKENSSEEPIRYCDHKGCLAVGEFRAPKNRKQLRDYYWFCLEHVREYNKSWDYYKDMTPGEIEYSRVSDVTWERPSWPLGGGASPFARFRYADGIDPARFAADTKQAKKKLSTPQEIKGALAVLDLEFPFDEKQLKVIYKPLAKKYHPDTNPGNKEAEDKLKSINEAYATLKKFLRS